MAKIIKKCSKCKYYEYDKSNYYTSFGNEYYQREHLCKHPDFGKFEILKPHKCHILPIRTVCTNSFCEYFEIKNNYENT